LFTFCCCHACRFWEGMGLAMKSALHRDQRRWTTRTPR
jgi:hypothetical protein